VGLAAVGTDRGVLMAIVDFRVDDVVALRKRHPCGGFEWRVSRIGADIGLICTTCGRRVMLARPVAERRLKNFVSRGGASTPPDPTAAASDETGA
jgi:hypothetical protein